MLDKLKNDKKFQFGVLIILGVIFFFVYSFLIFDNELTRFTWPDETANYFFITNYIDNSNFSFYEPLNEIGSNLIKPRSFNVYQNNLVPGSFLGMLLIYGLIGKIIGTKLILFLTPLLAVISGLFFYKILLKIFKSNIAFLSALLFFINPAWWYYASLSMLPNISFFSFLLIGFYCLLNLNKNQKKNTLWLILGSFFIALALIIRTNEFVWVLGVILFLAIVYRCKLKWYYILIFIAVNCLVFLPIFYYNQITYGDYLSFGYLQLEQGNGLVSQLPPEFQTANQSAIYNFIKFLILPFGFSAGAIIHNINQYFIQLFWWLFIPSVIGLFVLIKNFHKQAKGVYLLITFCLSVYLAIYYGSWIFEDQMTLQLNKIGLSYVRYFLPIYILCLPLIAIFYLHLIGLFTARGGKSKKFKIALSTFLAFCFIAFTVNVVYLSGNDNLLNIKQHIKDYNQSNQKIVELTEPEAVIISQRSDKIFFPQRKVIAKWSFDEAGYWADLLKADVPLYYYAFEGQEYIDEFNYNLYDYYGFELMQPVKINQTETLYKIKFTEYEQE
ncbi:MAG: hypothetical protein GF365_05285 [Candidatus Buchananbacteria bacterium]|nr:hypothetical protein [Candidatus Buchananbacteria bacterium]